MEIQGRTGKMDLVELQGYLEPQVTLDPQEKMDRRDQRETTGYWVGQESQDPGVHQDHPVSEVLMETMESRESKEKMDFQELWDYLEDLACLDLRALQANGDSRVSEEKRVSRASLVSLPQD